MFKKIPDTFVIIFVLIVIAAALTWFVPGGRIMKNETLENAFERITLAETGKAVPITEAGFLGVYQHADRLDASGLWLGRNEPVPEKYCIR